jgi:hypothetical protein
MFSTIYYKIDRTIFFNSVNFEDKNSLLNAVRQDWKRMEVTINKKTFKNYYDFLDIIDSKYSYYKEKIYMLSNQCAHFYNYNKIFEILSEYDFHFSTKQDLDESEKSQKVITRFNFSPIIKQVIIINTYDIYKVLNDIKLYRVIKVTTMIDLSTLDPVIVKLEFLDKL